MTLKLFGLGFLGYLQDWFNVFDGTIVLISLSEFAMDSESSGFSVLRAFRLLRIFKLISKFKGLKSLV